jgi:hypothetical protein
MGTLRRPVCLSWAGCFVQCFPQSSQMVYLLCALLLPRVDLANDSIAITKLAAAPWIVETWKFKRTLCCSLSLKCRSPVLFALRARDQIVGQCSFSFPFIARLLTLLSAALTSAAICAHFAASLSLSPSSLSTNARWRARAASYSAC